MHPDGLGLQVSVENQQHHPIGPNQQLFLPASFASELFHVRGNQTKASVTCVQPGPAPAVTVLGLRQCSLRALACRSPQFSRQPPREEAVVSVSD